MRKKVYGFIFLVGILVAAWTFIAQPLLDSSDALANGDPGAAEEAGEKKNDAEEAVPVELAAVRTGEISSHLDSTANLRPLREVDVVSESQGKVLQLGTEEGDRVEKGQILCRLDDRQLQIRLQSARQKLAQARLQAEKAQIRREKAQIQIRNSREELDRYETLYREKLVSEREVAQLGYKLDELGQDERVSSNETRELAHRVEELQAEIAEVQLQIDQTVIRAPFAGVISSRSVELGQTVGSGVQLFRLGQFTPLFADVHLSEQEAHQIRKGQPAAITLGVDNQQAAAGQVDRISPVVDKATGTVKVTVRVTDADAGLLKPGAFVRVSIETDSRPQALLVPKRAIVELDGKSFVFVASDGRVRRQEVLRGYESDGVTEVIEGLASGQQVVVAGQGALKDGSRIKVSAS